MGERFGAASAGGYDRGFGHVSREFIPAVLRAARLAPGQRVLDVATGTGLAVEASVEAVGPLGHVVATDLFSAMFEKARERLGHLPQTSPRVNTAGEAAEHLCDNETLSTMLCAGLQHRLLKRAPLKKER